MKGRKRMLIPGEPWELGLLEAWLEEQAVRGWVLERTGGLLGVFRSAEEGPCRVRLCPQGDRSWDRQQELNEIYREMSWDFACRGRAALSVRAYSIGGVEEHLEDYAAILAEVQ